MRYGRGRKNGAFGVARQVLIQHRNYRGSDVELTGKHWLQMGRERRFPAELPAINRL